MSKLIIYAHPYEKSFCNAIFNELKENFTDNNDKFNIIDLYKEDFDPKYSKDELRLYSLGQTNDSLVNKYQNYLLNVDEIFFVSPIWWNSEPAIVKGFVDKVMKKKFAYTVGKTGVKGNFKKIKKVTYISTSTSPTWYLRFLCGNAIKGVFLNKTFKQLGIKKTKWINFGNIDKSSLVKRNNFLKFIKSYRG